MHHRSIFISDLHLGTKGCQAEALLDFLKVVYLNVVLINDRIKYLFAQYCETKLQLPQVFEDYQ